MIFKKYLSRYRLRWADAGGHLICGRFMFELHLHRSNFKATLNLDVE